MQEYAETPGYFDGKDEEEDEDEVSLQIKIDAMRRMRAFSAVQSGENVLQSGVYQKEMNSLLGRGPLEQTVTEVRAAMRQRIEGEKDAILLDVREQDEFAFCRIDGAMLIPLSEMTMRADEVPNDRQVFVYCHHGMRSMQVVRYLRTRGFLSVTNVAGGIDAWSTQIDTSIPQY